jgi:hypothetical protein
MLKQKLPYTIIAIIFFLYAFIRALQLGITYDEAYTLSYLVPETYLQIITYHDVDANNHILNSILIKFLFSFTGKFLFVARIPNLMAFGLFLLFAYKICFEFLKNNIGLYVFFLLIANPFMLDFFGLARGYGLALGFQITSLYFIISFFNSKLLKHALIAIIAALLAVLCNFTMLNYFIVLIFVLNVGVFYFKLNVKKHILILYSIGATLILGLIIYGPISKLNAQGSFYYGGNSNFYTDTLLSLTKYFLYSMELTTIALIALPLFLLVLIGFLVFSVIKNKIEMSSKIILVAILFLCVLSTIVQHYALGTLYLVDRTALLFYPLLILTLGFAAHELQHRKLTYPILLGISILFLSNFLLKANFYKTVTWFFDSRTEYVLQWLNEKGRQNNKLIKLYYSWPFESSITYYYSSTKYPFIEHLKEKNTAFDASTDCYIYCGKSLDKISYKIEEQNQITSFKKDTLLQFKEDAIYVFDNIHE